MPKQKKARIANAHSGPRGGDAAAAAATKKGKGNKKMHTFPRLSTSNNNPNANSNSNTNKNKQKQQQQQQRRPIIPFGKGDRVLLIGEGKFCFIIYVFELCMYMHSSADKIKSQVTSPLPTLWSSSTNAGMYLQPAMTLKMLCIASIRK